MSTEQPQKPRAKGRWSTKTETVRHPAATETVRTDTFTARSGYTAVMTQTRNTGRREPFLATIRTPDGRKAARITDAGHRIEGMEIHLNLRDARLTVEEAVAEIENVDGSASPK